MWLVPCGPAAALERTLDEVVVTAQKREQSVQDVPIVVTAVSGSCCVTPACATSRTSRS